MAFRYVPTYGEGFRAIRVPLPPRSSLRDAPWSSINGDTVGLAMWESRFRSNGDEYIFDSYEEDGPAAWYRNLSGGREARNRLRSNHLQSLSGRPFRAFITIRLQLDDYFNVGHRMVVDSLELVTIKLDPDTCQHLARVIHPSRGHLKVCSPTHANSDKPRTRSLMARQSLSLLSLLPRACLNRACSYEASQQWPESRHSASHKSCFRCEANQPRVY